jgi:hypothetical protein
VLLWRGPGRMGRWERQGRRILEWLRKFGDGEGREEGRGWREGWALGFGRDAV